MCCALTGVSLHCARGPLVWQEVANAQYEFTGSELPVYERFEYVECKPKTNCMFSTWLASSVAAVDGGESLKNFSRPELQLILYVNKKPSASWCPHRKCCIWITGFFLKVSHGVLCTWIATLYDTKGPLECPFFCWSYVGIKFDKFLIKLKCCSVH